MKRFLLVLLLLSACGVAEPAAPTSPPSQSSTGQRPQYYPANGAIEGIIVEIVPRGEGRYRIETTPADPNTGVRASIGSWPTTTIFAHQNTVTQPTTLDALNIGDTIIVYPDGTVSTSDPISFRAAEIIIIR